MDPDGVAVANGLAIDSLTGALCLDAVLLLVVFALKVFLYDGIVVLVSRNEARRNRKFFVCMVLVLGAIYALLNPSGLPGALSRGLIACVFVATILTRKACWIELDKALLATLFYCVLSIAIDVYSSYGLDRVIQNRRTINRTLAQLVDARVRRQTGNASLPASPGIVAAVYRLGTTSSGGNGILDAIFAPLRAGMQAKEEITDVNELASAQAAIVNALSGAETNVGDRAEELRALRAQLQAESAGHPNPPAAPTDRRPPPVSPTVRGTPPASATTPPPAVPGAGLIHSLAEKAKTLSSPRDPNGTAVPTPAVPAPGTAPQIADRHASGVPATAEPQAARPPPPVRAQANGVPAAAGMTNATAAADNEAYARMTPSERQRWLAARNSIRVSAAGWTANNAYVIVNGQFIGLGAVYKFTFEGRSYAFCLHGVNAKRDCKWVPVPDIAKASNVDFISF